MQGQVEVLNREIFDSLISKKIEQGGSITDFSRGVENNIKRKQYTLAGEYLHKMEKLYSQNEEYYLLRINYLASLGRGEDIKKLLAEIDDRHIFLTSRAKEVLAFWDN